MIHTIEILAQNAPLGSIIAVLLLRRKSIASPAPASKRAAASM
jgi:hypothetical protein